MSRWWVDEEGAVVLSGARLDSTRKSDQTTYVDQFSKNWSDVKGSLRGLSPNFRRRAARLEKRDGRTSIDTSQAYITAYGMFDVVTPPYSLDELARYYETSYA